MFLLKSVAHFYIPGIRELEVSPATSTLIVNYLGADQHANGASGIYHLGKYIMSVKIQFSGIEVKTVTRTRASSEGCWEISIIVDEE